MSSWFNGSLNLDGLTSKLTEMVHTGQEQLAGLDSKMTKALSTGPSPLGRHPDHPSSPGRDSDRSKSREPTVDLDKLEQLNQHWQQEIHRLQMEFAQKLAHRDEMINRLETALEENHAFQDATQERDVLQQKLGKAVEHLKRLTEENMALNQRLNDMESKESISEPQQMAVNSSGQVAALQEEIANMKLEKQELEIQVQGLLMEKDELSDQLNQAPRPDVLLELQNNLNVLKEQLKAVSAEKQDIQSNLSQEIASLKARNIELQQEMTSMPTQQESDAPLKIQTLENEMTLLQQQHQQDILKYEQNMQTLKEKIENLEADLEREKLLKELDLDSLDAEATVCETKENVSDVELGELNALLDSSRKENQDLKQRLEFISKSEKNMIAKINDLEKKTADLNHKLALAEKKQSNVSDVESELEQVRAVLEEKENIVADLNHKLALAEKKQSTASDVESQLEQVRAVLEQKENIVADLNHKLALAEKKQSTASDVESELEQVRAVLKQKENIVADLNHKLALAEKKQSNTSDIQSQLEQVRAVLEQKENILVDLKSNLKASEQREASLNQQFHQSQIGLQQSQEQVTMLIEKLDQVSVIENDLRNQLEQNKQNHEKAIQDLKLEMEEAELKWQLDRDDEASNQTLALHHEITQLKQHVQHLEKEKQQTMTQIQALENEKSVTTSHISQLQSEIQSQKQTMTQLETDVEAYCATIKELEMRQEMSNQTTRELHEKSAALELVQQELQNVKKALEMSEAEKSRLESSAPSAETSQGNHVAYDKVNGILRHIVRRLEGLIQGHLDDQDPIFVDFKDDELTWILPELESIDATFQLAQATFKEIRQQMDVVQCAIKELEASKNLVEQELVSCRHQMGDVQAIMTERDQYRSDYELMVEKLKDMKNKVGTRLQQEMEEGERLRAENETMGKNNASLALQVTELQQALEQLQQEYTQLVNTSAQSGDPTELENTKHLLWKSQRELERLREHMIEIQEERDLEVLKAEEAIKEYRVQMETIMNDKTDLEVICEERMAEVAQMAEKMKEFQDLLADKEEECQRMRDESHQTALSAENLQLALQEFQSNKEVELEAAIKGMKERLAAAEAQVETWKETAESYQTTLVDLQENVPTVEKIRLELKEKMALVEKLQRELAQTQSYLAEAMRRMRDGSEETVDRRVIANLLVSFITSPRGDKTRYEMLSVIANILKFSEDEKHKVGISGKPTGSNTANTPTSDSTIGSFTDMWVSFLMSQAEADNTQKLLPAEPPLEPPSTPSRSWFGSLGRR